MISRLTCLVSSTLLLVVLGGCNSMTAKLKSGPRLEHDEKTQSWKLVNYVTPEEFANMTEEERKRSNAAVGYSVKTSKRPRPRNLSYVELDQARSR